MNKIQPSADVEARPWVSMSHSGIVCYLSRSDKFILAIIIGDGAFGRAYHMKNLFPRTRLWRSDINHDLSDLPSKAVESEQTL